MRKPLDIDHIVRRTYRSLEWDRLKSFLAQDAESAPGKNACLQVEPSEVPVEVEQLLNETNEAVSLIQARSGLSIAGLPEMAEVIGRLETGAPLSVKELLSVSKTLTISRQAKGSLSLLPKESFEQLIKFIPHIYGIDAVINAIDAALNPSGEVKDEASSALRSLRREVHRLDNNIKDELLRIINSSTLSKALQEPLYTQRNGRYVYPVNANQRAQIDGIVHDSSASGLTVYVEPMVVVELANKMRIKES